MGRAPAIFGATFLCLASLVGGQEAPAFRVFGDLEHSGKIGGPLPTAPKPGAFAITVPLPTNGAERDVLRPPSEAGEDLAPRLGRLRVEVKGGADVSFSVNGEHAGALRLYQKTDAGWRRAAPEKGLSWTLTANPSGVLEVGVGVVLPEAKAGADEPGWPGAFTVEIARRADGGEPVRVPFRVAPFLIPSPLDPVERMLIVSHANTREAVKALEGFAHETGLKLYVHQAKPPCDQWMQDTIEPGVFAFPAAEGVRQAQAALSGLRKDFGSWSAALDQQVVERLREDGVITLAPGVPRRGTRWIDWYGNLEVTPPHTDKSGRRIPYDRILTGRQRDLGMHPGVMKFLQAQALQWPPVVVDTSWLMIGHVDEVVNFVPAKTTAGFKVLLPSPRAARDLLDALLVKGLGELPVFENTRGATTVRRLRDQTAASKENLAIDETIDGIRKQLREELNLDDADFVRLPVLFARGGAVIPNAVNSAVVNGHVLAPEPRGPRQEGKDLFEEAIRDALAGCDVCVVFVDAWRAYHAAGGEFHCGTNTFRRLRDPAWWKQVERPGS
jgi:protein-arginine deiminase